ncbi:hypothetical protein [Sphingomonas aerolata]|uniref:hypothetical protein n=1 Tax=Sphingomonas aerolata TaxID=185951 RepID=UPI002FE00A87
MDRPPLDREGLIRRADTGHRVRDEHEPVMRAAAQCDPQRGIIDVKAVDDDPAIDRLIVERCADHAGRAVDQRRHRVEQMGHAGDARSDARGGGCDELASL